MEIKTPLLLLSITDWVQSKRNKNSVCYGSNSTKELQLAEITL